LQFIPKWWLCFEPVVELSKEKWQNTEMLTGFILYIVTFSKYRRLFGYGKCIELEKVKQVEPQQLFF
jgi:hypothetical protein